MESITNFVQLTETIGTSGQPTENQFKLIADAGYAVVINLAMPEHPESISNEGELVTQLGMDYIHIPVAYDDPKPVQLRRFCKLMVALDQERVFVHCIMNYRVSAFMYHYLHKVKALEHNLARSPIFAKWEPDQKWASLLNWSSDEIGL